MFNDDFYPTPYGLAVKMVNTFKNSPTYILEPSAGKGNLVDVIHNKWRYANVDVIESDPNLLAILSKKEKLSIVGLDWLSYDGVSYYDAIMMNPPFSNGTEHLLKAWNFLNNGEIVCLLNAETIKNPYSKNRQLLKDIIDKNGTVEFIQNAFKDSERKTDVEVALVYLSKKTDDDDLSNLWNIKTDEKELKSDIEANNLPAIQDKIGNMQIIYDEANKYMIEAIKNIRKANLCFGKNSVNMWQTDLEKILSKALTSHKEAIAEFSKLHRKNAWKQIFELTEFNKFMDKKQKSSFYEDIEKSGNFPFTKENIKGTLENLFLQRNELFEKSLVNVFEELLKYHNGNKTYTEGWKTNSNYKVNKKIIFPHGVEYDSAYSFAKWKTSYYGRLDLTQDLDRVLCVLSGKNFTECLTVKQALSNQFNENKGDLKYCESEFFHIKYFQKGTVHLEFKDDNLWKELNIKAAKGAARLGLI